MLLLIASLLALFAGPALVLTFNRSRTSLVALDAFVVVAITGLVMLHIVPDSISMAGWPAVLALVVGLVLPSLAHGAHAHCDTRTPGIFLLLALSALGLHALLDGVALVPHSNEGGIWGVLNAPLALGVVLHRLVEGVGVWWLLGQHTRRAVRIAALGAVGALTLTGYMAGLWAMAEGAVAAMAWVQAMVAGSLLHVLMRHAPADTLGDGNHAHGDAHAKHGQTSTRERVASGLGAAMGLTLLAALHLAEAAHEHGHGHDHTHVLSSQFYLEALAMRIAPAVLCALALAAMMHTLAPRWHSAARQGSYPLGAALRGTVQGLLLAPCSCGVVPLYRRLVQRRAPDAQATAYLLAAPGLGLVTLWVSWTLLGPTLTLIRVMGAIGLSSLIAAASAYKAPTHHGATSEQQAPKAHRHHTPQTPLGRVLDGLSFALGEVSDFTGPWVVFGLLAAALCAQGLDAGWIAGLTAAHVAVPVMALVAAPVYLCGSASTLIGVVLLAKGLSVGAALAFMWAAAMVSPASLGALKGRFGSRRTSLITAFLCLGTMLLGWITDSGFAVATPDLTWMTQAADERALPWGAALWVLLGWAIARQGVREAVDQIALPNREGALSHHHPCHEG